MPSFASSSPSRPARSDAPLSSILLEPIARNTAPALAAAAFVVLREHGDEAIMQVLASDHEIDAGEHYFDCIRIARETAQVRKAGDVRHQPTEPATGYGYIEIGDDLETGAKTVARFVEKPNRERAEELLASGRYLWNSGMFMLPVGQFLAEILRMRRPSTMRLSAPSRARKRDLDFDRLDEADFLAGAGYLGRLCSV